MSALSRIFASVRKNWLVRNVLSVIFMIHAWIMTSIFWVTINRNVASLAKESKLIQRLIDNGYNSTHLRVLLRDLNIYECPCDVYTLLIAASSSDNTVFRATLQRIGIERAITMCDELCASVVIDKIISMNVRLHNMNCNQTINNNIRDDNLIQAYNNGHRLISCYPETRIVCSTLLDVNNAIENGLLITDTLVIDARFIDLPVRVIDFPILKNSQITSPNISSNATGISKKSYESLKNNFADISNISSTWRFNSTAIYNDLIISCKNIDLITICDDDWQYSQYNQFVKDLPNIKNLVISGHGSHWSIKRGSYNTNLTHFPNLTKCDAGNNSRISTCKPFAKTLKILNISADCGVGDYGLRLCKSIKELCVNGNRYITTCAPFARTLKVLRNSIGENCYYSNLNDASIMMCTRIKMLYVSGNHNITTCAPFAKTLKYLEANDGCGIGDDGIKMCTKLKSLSVDNNCNITTCAPFANTLVKLSACGIHSKIGDAGLVRCTKIVELRANQNHNITTCAPFAATLVTLYTPYERGISYNSIKMCTKLRNICRYPFD